MNHSECCQLCGSTEFRSVGDRFRGDRPAVILQCMSCELIFHRAMGSPEAVYDFYRREYPGNYQYRTEMNRARFARLEPILHDKLNVLEVGCSSGEFLDIIRPRVKSVAGVELMPKDVATARGRYGLTVYERPVEELEIDSAFDLILAFQCFEHVPNPNQFLSCLRKMLRPDGKLILEVPNVNEPLLALYGLEEFRRFYFVPQHLFYYSQKTLPRMLAKNGFVPGKPMLIQMGTLTNHLHWLHTRGPQRNIAEVCRVVLPDGVHAPEAVEILASVDRQYRDALVARGYSDVLWIEAVPDGSFDAARPRRKT